MRAELGALEASAERAGTALACIHASADPFEGAQVRARRPGAWWRPHTIDAMQVVLVATVVAAVAALAALAGVAAIAL